MPILKYFGVVGSASLALLFVPDYCCDDDERNSRFHASLYQITLYEPRLEEAIATRERRFTHDATPASRVKEIFALFGPNENKRVRRYSSTGTVIR
jgi:hypothetical protein